MNSVQIDGFDKLTSNPEVIWAKQWSGVDSDALCQWLDANGYKYQVQVEDKPQSAEDIEQWGENPATLLYIIGKRPYSSTTLPPLGWFIIGPNGSLGNLHNAQVEHGYTVEHADS